MPWPCGPCPFKTKAIPGKRHLQALELPQYKCIKNPDLECCGHMHICHKSVMSDVMAKMKIEQDIDVSDLISTETAFIKHHNRKW